MISMVMGQDALTLVGMAKESKTSRSAVINATMVTFKTVMGAPLHANLSLEAGTASLLHCRVNQTSAFRLVEMEEDRQKSNAMMETQ